MHDSLAIVGMACRLPGADGLEAFWDLVVHGRTAWGRLPDSRLPRDLYFDPEKSKVGKSYSDLGAIVSERPADPAVCPIREDMLDRYDVAHHIFLEVASLACRDAGLDPFAMPRGPRTGVYVGHTGGSTRIGDYVYSTGIDGTTAWLGDVEAARELLGAGADSVAAEVTAAVRRDHPGRRPGEKLDLGALGAAKIVREALHLDGPYLVVDAACASSLQALAIAARALQQGGIDQAIVGGASYCKSDSLVLFSAAQSVSNSGSCPFGREADGLVTAEGYVALVVKKLSKAVADGDRIRAVIRGIGVASDGKGKSLWAPRQEGQKLAVERAYPDKREIGRLDYIEAHATSTQVGDATELGALSALVSANVPAGRKIPIGSVKANIGHTLETAGMASLVKVVLAMEHGLIPPGSTCSEYNEDFDWERGPFVVPSKSIPWPKRADGEARRAAVNAFGIGGLNVHLALAEHLPGRSAAARPPAAPKGSADDDAVAIVGIGSVLPGALSVDAFRALVRQGQTAIGPVPASRFDVARALDPRAPRTWHTVAGVGGFVEGFVYDWRRHKVPPKQIAAANPLQFMLLEAADAAIAEVGGVASLDRVRTGVVVGTMFGGEFSNDLQMGLRLPETSRHLRAALGRRGIAPRDIERIVEGYGKKLLEKMPALVDETGSFTSSTLASRLTKSFDLMGGALALDSGDCSGVSALSAAVDLLRERDCDAVLCAAGQRYLDLMAYEGFSLQGVLADGPSSAFDAAHGGRVPGEGAVVLVLKRLTDARSAGNRIHGVIRGVSVGSGASVAETAARVVREARLQSGIVPGAVRALEVAGSGTRDIDEPELRALANEYGIEPVAGAIEGLVGHLGAAAAAAGMIKLADVLESGRMPPTVAAGSAEPGMPAASSATMVVPAVDASGYRAGSITVVNETQVGHVVMDNGRPVPSAAREQAASAPARLVSPAQARTREPVAAAGRPLVAALFPGQGSQYTDMFRGLLAESTAARQAAEHLDALARSAGFETLAGVAWQSDNAMGTAVWDTQWGMYLGDLLAWTVLEGMGFSPDMIASHSFGEFPSLVAAGAWSFAEGARATKARAVAVDELGPKQGAMLSVIARREEVAAAIEPFAGQVWVCAENAPEQSVIGGHARAVDAVEVLLEARRIRSKRLAVPSPFHTPLLAPSAAKLAEAIDRMAIVPPSRRVYSSTTAAPMATVADVRESLVRQMTQTVRWVDVVEKLWAEGVRTFVEVGPSGVLTGLTRRVLEGRQGATFIQFDQRGRDVAGHLAKVREQLQAVGAIGAAVAVPGPVAVAPAPRPTTVLSFDATARRRARNRAGGGPVRPAATSAKPTSPASTPPKPQPVANGQPAVVVAAMPAAVVQSVSVKPVPVPSASVATGVNRLAPTPAAQPSAPRAGAAVELESFLVDFVVDQTGYPKEIVELDADLEGDLGIDSIRKAQLFGEIGQRYGLSADASVSLDDFRTLRHLLDYMLPRVGGSADAAAIPTRSGHAATNGSSRSSHAANGHGSNGHSANGHASFGHDGNGHTSNGHARAASATAVVELPVVGSDRAVELEAFLVDFVVEQTGYPKEIVELDADLEGDLGIDSIRKAQLFGEIGQRYGLSADASVSLDDFRTLRHLLDYMLPRVGGSASPSAASVAAVASRAISAAPAALAPPAPLAPSASLAPPAPLAPSTSAGGELETFLVDFVVEQTGYPREIVELDADLEGDLGIDSIRKAQLFGEIGQRYGLSADASVSLDDFRTLRHLLDYMLPRVGGSASPSAASVAAAASRAISAAPAALASPAPLAPSTSAGGELETFLVDFVVEQTGYPREIVELDADLEGDLGIDSIRKAQLFGEIGQRYGLSADASVSLDDFRTLRHLLDYMLPRVGGSASPSAASVAAVADVAAPVAEPAIDPLRAAAIRQWAREFAAAAPVAVTAVKLSADTLACLESTATAAGIDQALLVAAMASPTTAVGGLDVILGGARGIAVGFGRHAAPSCEPFSAEGVSGYLVGIEGLPGGLVGWNDAGLMVVAGHGAGLAGGLPLTEVVERLSRCRTLVDAGRTAALLAPIGGTLLVAVDGSIGVIDGHGRMADGGSSLAACAALAPLVRVAGDATGHVDLERLLGVTTGAGVRDGLSATATWLAAGAVGGATVSFAGGPRGSWLPASAAAMLAAAWRRSAAVQASSVQTPNSAEVTGRFGLALADLAPPEASRSLAGERVVVLVGTDPAGRTLGAELVSGLAARRCEAIELPLTTASDVIAGLAAAEAHGPVRHLVIASPWSAGEDWVAVRESAVNAGYFACQQFLSTRSRAGDAARSTLTAVVGLGGDFGVGGAIGSAVGGAYAGLCKNLAREYPEVLIRVADFATTATAADVAARTIAEIGSAGPVEVGWQGGRRRTVVAAAAVPRAAAPLAGLARGSVWLVTGGARGVTAACARALGAKHGLELVLVGSTRPQPVDQAWLALDEAGLKAIKSRVMLEAKARGADPRRAWRDVEKSIEIASGLAKFRAAGVAARYEACDLADGAAVGQLVGRIEHEVGPIRGVVHGAGWESACKFEKKTADGLEATLGPKCIGLEHVVAAVDPRHLESVVAFGSTSGRLGGLGQADYSLANDMLAKIIGRLRSGRRSLRATVFHWHAWDEVGMASRPESRFVLEQFGMKFMPLAEGVERFMTELEAGLPEAEVLVTEPVFCLDTLSPTAGHAHAAVTTVSACSHGSLVSGVERSGGATNVRFLLDPTADRFLTEHRQYKRPLLPAVMGAELLAQATIAAVGCQQVGEIRDFVVERPLGFPTDQSREVRVEIEPGADGTVVARGWATVRGADGRDGDLPRVHFAATVLTGAPEPIAARLDDMLFPWNPMVYQDDGPMWHGPSFRTLSGLFLDRSGGWGRLTAPAADVVAEPRGAAGWTVPAAMLDGAIVGCAVYSYVLCGKRVEVPVRFERLRVVGNAATGEKCTVRLHFRSQDSQKTVYDFTIFGADGRPLVAVDGLHLAVLSPERRGPA